MRQINKTEPSTIPSSVAIAPRSTLLRPILVPDGKPGCARRVSEPLYVVFLFYVLPLLSLSFIYPSLLIISISFLSPLLSPGFVNAGRRFTAPHGCGLITTSRGQGPGMSFLHAYLTRTTGVSRVPFLSALPRCRRDPRSRPEPLSRACSFSPSVSRLLYATRLRVAVIFVLLRLIAMRRCTVSSPRLHLHPCDIVIDTCPYDLDSASPLPCTFALANGTSLPRLARSCFLATWC